MTHTCSIPLAVSCVAYACCAGELKRRCTTQTVKKKCGASTFPRCNHKQFSECCSSKSTLKKGSSRVQEDKMERKGEERKYT
ncbi:hypothetical protein Y032_0043g767 [Ancylostoma ceylanicum]|uniref:Secreted protein n=1 Tax=Ancylostoma ceylanicum TaxID=53326 RepID=A0A016UG25_9BILA|nr:hypothetical protein Y032_0043g767 [Ancylostoma ceylanicum]